MIIGISCKLIQMESIPIYQPSLNGNEKEYVMDCLDSTWISSKGKYVEEFERKFSDYIGTQYGAAVTNGTVALHLALLALGIGEGDEIIVPTFTYIASVNVIKYVNATPIFVDSKLESWQMDPEEIKKNITPKTKAIIAVHLYGHPCEIETIAKIAKENELFLIEDCAEAIGSKYGEKKVGTYGEVACFSFFGNKTITCGEGGMVLTNNATLYERMGRLKSQGLAKNREYWHDIIGYNFRMTNICAAIGVAQLQQIDTFIERKIQIGRMYSSYLKNLPVKTHEPVGNVLHTFWMCSILVDDLKDRDLLRNYLAKNGIETRPTFYPIHTMPIYSDKFQYFPIAEYLGWHGINLPSWPGLTDEQISYICEIIRLFYEKIKVSKV